MQMWCSMENEAASATFNYEPFLDEQEIEAFEARYGARRDRLMAELSNDMHGVTVRNLNTPMMCEHRRHLPRDYSLFRFHPDCWERKEALEKLAEVAGYTFHTQFIFDLVDRLVERGELGNRVVAEDLREAVLRRLFRENTPFSRDIVYDELLRLSEWWEYGMRKVPWYEVALRVLQMKSESRNNLFVVEVCECVASRILETHEDEMDLEMYASAYRDIYAEASSAMQCVMAHNYGRPVTRTSGSVGDEKRSTTTMLTLKDDAFTALYASFEGRIWMKKELGHRLYKCLQPEELKKQQRNWGVEFSMDEIYKWKRMGTSGELVVPLPRGRRIVLVLMPFSIMYPEEMIE